MHEVSLMQEVLTLAEATARERQATCIHRLSLRIGPLSGVEPEALRFAFAALREGTMAQAADLEMHVVPIHCHCARCGTSFTPPEMVFLCPGCGGLVPEAAQGREFELASLEVS